MENLIEITVRYKDKVMNVVFDEMAFMDLNAMNVNATKEMFSALNEEIVAMINADKA